MTTKLKFLQKLWYVYTYMPYLVPSENYFNTHTNDHIGKSLSFLQTYLSDRVITNSNSWESSVDSKINPNSNNEYVAIHAWTLFMFYANVFIINMHCIWIMHSLYTQSVPENVVIYNFSCAVDNSTLFRCVLELSRTRMSIFENDDVQFSTLLLFVLHGQVYLGGHHSATYHHVM